MFSVDINKLKGKIVEKGFNQTTFANALGISLPTFRKYIAFPEKIPLCMINKMSEILCGNNAKEASEIFFVRKLT